MTNHEQAGSEGFLSRLPSELAELLRTVASEEGAPNAAARARLEDWPEHRDAIEDWLSTLDLVREGAVEDRELLRELESLPLDQGDLALVHKFIDKQVRPRPRRDLWLKLAAALIVAFGLGWWLLPQASGPTAPGDPPTWLAEPLDGLSPRGELDPAAPLRFAWEPYALPPFGEFRIRVETADGSLLFEETVSQPGYSPVPDRVEALRSAGRFAWRVEAIDRDGRRIAWGAEFTEAWLPGH